ncbi:MAG: heat shock protein Hsp18 [Clostridiaceae bacterium]
MLEMIPFGKSGLKIKDDIFSPFFKDFFDEDFLASMNNVGGNFKVDLKETDDKYLIEADLPGVKKEDIKVDIKDNYLVINAKREESKEDKKENYVRREKHYGEFTRSFYVDNIDENTIDAAFKDGVLKITLQKLAKGKEETKKIEVK